MKEELAEIGREIIKQDNRETDQPMFLVQAKEKITGLDSLYSDFTEWVEWETGDHIHGPPSLFIEDDDCWPEIKSLEDLKENDNFVEFGCRWEWRTLTTCFTEKGCQDFIKADGHNHGELRIYADGSYRNFEFRKIRDALISIANQQKKRNE